MDVLVQSTIDERQGAPGKARQGRKILRPAETESSSRETVTSIEENGFPLDTYLFREY